MFGFVYPVQRNPAKVFPIVRNSASKILQSYIAVILRSSLEDLSPKNSSTPMLGVQAFKGLYNQFSGRCPNNTHIRGNDEDTQVNEINLFTFPLYRIQFCSFRLVQPVPLLSYIPFTLHSNKFTKKRFTK